MKTKEIKQPATNKSEIYNKAFKYILNAIDATGYGNYQLKSDAEKLQFLVDTFKSEYGHNVKSVGQQKAFVNWMQGLPTCFNIDFENYRIIEIAKEWGSLEKGATDKQEDKILSTWHNFIYMRVSGLCRKNKIQF